MNENTDKSALNQIVAKIKSVSNILVTVSRNPSVDQLAAALAATLFLDKMGKHATAVVSGEIPPAINFLEPEKTFENNADSLRDFIISLDKQKADRLRFKVEGDIVKVLITPYRTKLLESDLSFGEGDFNVEFVLAIGVNKKDDLDGAIAAHGRIFHDATVATMNIENVKGSLGSIGWQDDQASSFSEMISNLAESFDGKDAALVDDQIATAILTGVVAATDHFRNEKTTPGVMTLAANLMAKGANQQLIASELSAVESDIVSNSAIDSNTIEIASVAESEQPIGELELHHDEETTEQPASVEVDANPAATELETTPTETNAMPAENPVRTAETEGDRLGAARSADALALAEAQLAEAQNQQKIASAPPQTAEAELDDMMAKTNPPAVTDELRAEAENRQNLSHGMPYVEENVKNPLNSALVNDEPPMVDSLSSFRASAGRTIQPTAPMISAAPVPAAINPDNTPAIDLPPVPTGDLVMPAPPPLPLPEAGALPPPTPDFSAPPTSSLPPVPTLSGSLETVKPAVPDSTALFPPVATAAPDDPTQFRIPPS